MSRPRSIYVVSMSSIFHFHFNYIIRMNTDALVFSEYILLFLDDNMGEECE